MNTAALKTAGCIIGGIAYVTLAALAASTEKPGWIIAAVGPIVILALVALAKSLYEYFVADEELRDFIKRNGL
jgi:hypothetical protein